MAIWWKPDDISFFGTQCKYMYSVGLKRLDNNVQTGPIFLAHPVYALEFMTAAMMKTDYKQDIWANAHEMCESL